MSDWWDEWGEDLFGVGVDLWNQQSSSDAIDSSRDDLEQGFQRQNPWSVYQPMMGAGLMNLLSDPGQVVNTPGYQFAYDQGLQSLFAKQAATGNRFSGGAMVDTMKFGQGLASQMYNQEANRYAQLSGAMQPIQGGNTLGQNNSALTQQQSYNQGYFWNNLFNTATSAFNPTSTGSGGDPYGGYTGATAGGR